MTVNIAAKFIHSCILLKSYLAGSGKNMLKGVNFWVSRTGGKRVASTIGAGQLYHFLAGPVLLRE